MFKNLQSKFDGRTELPIEIQDICDALVELGYQDEIHVTSEEMDLEQLLGSYAQWREPTGIYSEPKWVSLVVYPSNAEVELQRIVCAKELVHVCDSAATKTHEPEEIMELARVLCPRVAPEIKMQIAAMKVAKDVLAQGQALMLLFPKAARLIARKRIEDGSLSLEELAEIVCLPHATLEEMLNPEWENVADALQHL